MGVDLQHGDIAGAVRAQNLCLELPLVRQLDRDLFCAVDHVSVGQHQAVGRNQKARALGMHRAVRPRHLLPTKELQQRIVVIAVRITEIEFLWRCSFHGTGRRDADHGSLILRHDGPIVRRRRQADRLRHRRCRIARGGLACVGRVDMKQSGGGQPRGGTDGEQAHRGPDQCLGSKLHVISSKMRHSEKCHGDSFTCLP